MLPRQLFKDPLSTVIYSKEGHLLGAKIATDGQWRFPNDSLISDKFKQCILNFEDAHFYQHPGFNPVSIFKALVSNIKNDRVVRGGSTITQQVVRLWRRKANRTYFEKLIELVYAIRLEFRFSKEEILNLYVSNAPYGGNVVGLRAASWRYFGRLPSELSWGEAATLAVLPNAPSLIYPGKNQEKLLVKRNRLLSKLLEKELLDSLTYQLATLEPLPQKPHRLPQDATHLLEHIAKQNPEENVQTTIDIQLQKRVQHIVKQHYNDLSQNHIYNMAVLVLDVEHRKVLAYVGNSPTTKVNQKDVNIIHSPRSTGSILKPFLYTGMLDAGEILPEMLVADIPTVINSYRPTNFDDSYDGAVPANRALSRSLNIPAVRLLQQYGLNRFYDYLKQLQFTDITYDPNHYGLSLILGGAEVNLWDLCRNYAAYAGTVNHYEETNGKYLSNEFIAPTFYKNEEIDFGKQTTEKIIYDAGAIYLTLKALKEVNRPEGDENWEFFDSSREIAWKTGTSFGFRDAWSVGVTKDYVVGIWVGNADGEGRPGLVGVKTAAPIMFDVFDVLPRSSWFEAPLDELREVTICTKSGYRAQEYCTETKQDFIPYLGLNTIPCPYHKLVHLDSEELYQVNSSCEPLEQIKQVNWFALPPVMEYYYKRNNPFYKTLPSFRKDCITATQNFMEFVYPVNHAKITLTKGFDEQLNPLVVKLVHNQNDTATVFWYLDEQYVGKTTDIHDQTFFPDIGKHIIVAVDTSGNEQKLFIEVVD